MTRITDMNQLETGDTVLLFGSPFSDQVSMWNPFIVRVDKHYHGLCFRSTVNYDVEQICSRIRKNTYIFLGELTVEDEAELILEGLIND